MSEMNLPTAVRFIRETARPFERAAFEVLYDGASPEGAIEALRAYQNADGGFGHALEADNWNPNSNPIATNDAVIWLYRLGCIGAAGDIVQGIVRYLGSGDSFDMNKKRWLFAIESNINYPHAIWWEKKGSGIEGFNPTVSLAAFMVCYGDRSPLYEEMLREAVTYLRENMEMGGDPLKCYLLAYELLKMNGVEDIVDLEVMRKLIAAQIGRILCADTSKYGVEYVTAPSDLFGGVYREFISPEIAPLVRAELDMLGDLQLPDGGFDISWQWYTPYAEFAQARAWWRPRVTMEKVLMASGII